MWVRGIIGLVLIIAGVVWILQGANVLHGSGMSGHGGYAVLGAIVVVLGATLLGWAWRIRTRHTH
jgi:drug/metabolite transporter (DMT)-like permease